MNLTKFQTIFTNTLYWGFSYLFRYWNYYDFTSSFTNLFLWWWQCEICITLRLSPFSHAAVKTSAVMGQSHQILYLHK